jgi:hypothetical protein
VDWKGGFRVREGTADGRGFEEGKVFEEEGGVSRKGG